MKPGSGTKNNPTYEVWDPASGGLASVALHPTYVRAAKDIYYPNNYVLPSGDLYTFCDFTGLVMDPHNGSVKAWLPPLPRAASGLRTAYPNTATGLLLPLRSRDGYAVETMSFGGRAARLPLFCPPNAPPASQPSWAATRALRWPQALRLATRAADAGQGAAAAALPCFAGAGGQYTGATFSSPASDVSLRIRVQQDPATRAYKFEDWLVERMPYGRVMSDAVLLPNGRIIILNGAKVSCCCCCCYSGWQAQLQHPPELAVLPHGFYRPGEEAPARSVSDH
jgi:hypothetical protein